VSIYDRLDKTESFAKREAKWDALNATSHGVFQTRVHALLGEQPQIDGVDARIKTLAEEGWKEGKIAQAMGYRERTIYNRVSKMREIAGVDRKHPLRMIFITPPSQRELPAGAILKMN